MLDESFLFLFLFLSGSPLSSSVPLSSSRLLLPCKPLTPFSPCGDKSSLRRGSLNPLFPPATWGLKWHTGTRTQTH